jgi:hypothetical protein
VVEEIDDSHDDQLSAATFEEEAKHKSLGDHPDTVSDDDNHDDVKQNELDVDTVNEIGMYIYMYIDLYIHIDVYIHIYVYTNMCIDVYIFMYAYIFIAILCDQLYMCLYICIAL